MTKRILLVSGRCIIENPYRELPLLNLLRKKGFDAQLLLPGYNINAFGYDKQFQNDPVFQNNKCFWIDSLSAYKKLVKRYDAVMLGSWKTYSTLSHVARSYGKLVFGYQSTTGLDHWHNDVDFAFLISNFKKRFMLYAFKEFENIDDPPDSNSLIITGSIAHDRYINKHNNLKIDRETFLRSYDLNLGSNTVVLFPKATKVFSDKIDLWFRDWSEKKREAQKVWYLNKYEEICNAVINADSNLLIKMHPSAYASYRTSLSYERKFWNQFPWAKVLKPEDTYSCYEHLDFGIGINSQAALDLGYFDKPFIYVDSDQPAIPENLIKTHLTKTPNGPSSHWNRDGFDDVNPWFPSWLGHFSRAQDLPDLLNDPDAKRVSPEHREAFVKEYWYRSDGKASERIVSVVEKKLDEWNTIKQVKGKIYGLYQQSILTINRALKK